MSTKKSINLFANIEESLLRYSFGILLLLYLFLVSVDFHVKSQIILAYTTILIIFLFTRLSKKKPFWLQTILVILGLFLTLRYMHWRVTVSIEYSGFYDFTAMITLFIAEVYSVIIYVIGIFSSIAPLDRQIIDISNVPTDDLPTVDIFIPTYSEPVDIVANTALAAKSIDYPPDKFRVFILDDGGTDQKCNDLHVSSRNLARKRQIQLQEVAQKVGATYLTRPQNIGAKAGNLNEALARSKGELVLVLDCDHIPTRDFLKNTVGWFLRDPKMFLVQTPHSFYNPDPIERNMNTFGRAPGENQMFYQHIQKGHDFWESSFFCGSAALLRRTCLDEIGGIAGETVTEDAETALTLHAKGYKSAFISIPMVRGRNPDTFAGMVIQRIRWTQGMIQIFMLKNPIFTKGLKWYQKLSYISASGFWFFAFSRVVFMLAPLFYLFFGLQIYRADGLDLIAYTIPHVIAAAQVSRMMYRKVRWSLFSEMYETAISFFTLPAIIEVLIKPRAAQFKVTPKGEDITQDFISHLVYPFVIMFVLILLGYAFGVYRWINFPEERYIVAMTTAWNTFNLALVMTGLAISSEKGELRRFVRIPSNEFCHISIDQKILKGRIDDFSLGGAAVTMQEDPLASGIRLDQQDFVKIDIFDKNNKPISLKAEVIRLRKRLVLKFLEVEDNLSLRQKLVELLYGDETRWVDFDIREESPTHLRSFFMIMRQSFENVRPGAIFQQIRLDLLRRLRIGV